MDTAMIADDTTIVKSPIELGTAALGKSFVGFAVDDIRATMAMSQAISLKRIADALEEANRFINVDAPQPEPSAELTSIAGKFLGMKPENFIGSASMLAEIKKVCGYVLRRDETPGQDAPVDDLNLSDAVRDVVGLPPNPALPAPSTQAVAPKRAGR